MIPDSVQDAPGERNRSRPDEQNVVERSPVMDHIPPQDWYGKHDSDGDAEPWFPGQEQYAELSVPEEKQQQRQEDKHPRVFTLYGKARGESRDQEPFGIAGSQEMRCGPECRHPKQDERIVVDCGGASEQSHWSQVEHQCCDESVSPVLKQEMAHPIYKESRNTGNYEEGEPNGKWCIVPKETGGQANQVSDHARIVEVRPIQAARPRPIAAFIRDQVDVEGKDDAPEKNSGQSEEKPDHLHAGL